MPLIYLHSLIGGALIGLASALFLLLDGRIAGVCGIIGGSLRPAGENQLRNLLFLFGLSLDQSFTVWVSAAGRLFISKQALGSLRLPAFSSASARGLAPAARAVTASAAWRVFLEDRSLRSRPFSRLGWSRLP